MKLCWCIIFLTGVLLAMLARAGSGKSSVASPCRGRGADSVSACSARAVPANEVLRDLRLQDAIRNGDVPDTVQDDFTVHAHGEFPVSHRAEKHGAHADRQRFWRDHAHTEQRAPLPDPW